MTCCFSSSTRPTLPLIGMHQTSMYYGGGSPANDITDLNYIHGQIYRSELTWWAVEQSEGAYTWTGLDSIVNSIYALGNVTIAAMILESPQWASGSSNRYFLPWDSTQGVWDTFCARYAAFCGAVSARYGTKLVYEIWSEQNEAAWQPAGSTNPTKAIQRYGQLFTQAKTAITNASPAATVMIGGLTGLSASSGIRGTDYITGLINNGIAFEHLAIHPYNYPFDNDPGIHTPGTMNYDDVVLVYNLLQNYPSYRNVNLWCTECCSFDSANLGELTQANYVQTVMSRADSGFEGRIPPGVIRCVVVFLDRDQPGFDHMGVFNSSGTPKQAATRMRDYMASR